MKRVFMSGFAKIHKSGLWAIAGFCILLPLSFLFYQAWCNPRIEFLVPSLKGRWILHSADDVFADRLSGTVVFRRKFNLTEIPSRAVFNVKAASRFSISVNGRIVEADSRRTGKNWKRSRKYDVAPYFVGSWNIIEIRVDNSEGLPALRVEAPLLENGLDLSSNNLWESAREPNLSRWNRCIYPHQEPPAFGEEKSPVQKSFAYPILLCVYGLFILVAVNPRNLLHRPPPLNSQESEGMSRSRQHAGSDLFRRSARMALLAMAVLAILSIGVHNVKSFPYEKSCFDGKMHVDYIKYVAETWRVPLATQGWEMYHPPLYYFLSAIVYRLLDGAHHEILFLKAIQGLGFLSGLACILFTWLILRICLKGNYSMQLFGLSVSAFLPMLIYMSPNISNEVFSAAMMAFSLYLLIRFGFQDTIAIKHSVVLGAVFGLAMLSKYTAFLFLLVALGVFLLRIILRSGHRRREMAVLLIFTTVVFAVCGWFYVRNAVLFHNPFVANWDAQSGYHVEQPPGYRTLGFFMEFGGVLTHAPELSRWSSFWDGYYGSMWMDTHFSMLDHRDKKANSYGSVLLALALLPSAAMLLGLYRVLQRIVISRAFQPEMAIVIAVLIGIFAMIHFSLRVPSVTNSKAFYSLALLPAFGVFAGTGLSEMAGNLKKFSPILHLCLFALFALTGYLFWY
jgi:hypothetical protein